MDESIAETPAALCTRVFEQVGEGTVYAVNPAETLIPALVAAATAQDVQLRVIARPASGANAVEDFLVASRAPELADGGLRVHDDLTAAPAICTESQSFALITPADGPVSCVQTEDTDVVAAQYAEAESLWESGTPIGADVPSLSSITDSLAEQFGDEVAADFQTGLEQVDGLRGDDLTLSVYQLLILLGAVHQQQFAEVVSWAEDVDLCSRSSLSRAKHTLTEKSLVTTVKVKSGRGRPRQQLILPEELRSNSFKEMIPMALRHLTKKSPPTASV